MRPFYDLGLYFSFQILWVGVRKTKERKQKAKCKAANVQGGGEKKAGSGDHVRWSGWVRGGDDADADADADDADDADDDGLGEGEWIPGF